MQVTRGKSVVFKVRVIIVTHRRGCGGKKCKAYKNVDWLKKALRSVGLEARDLKFVESRVPVKVREDFYVGVLEGEWKSPFPDMWIFRYDNHFIEIRR